MLETGTGLLRRKGKYPENPRGINEIRADLIFRGANHQCSHKSNEISALRPELVFREVPRKLLQRGGQSKRVGRFCLCGALINPPRDGITRIPLAPVCRGFLTARRLAIRIPAGSLSASHSRVRPEPPATDRARFLPGLGHRDPSSSSRLQPPRDWRQFRMPGSFPASTGGSFLGSAEGNSLSARPSCRPSRRLQAAFAT